MSGDAETVRAWLPRISDDTPPAWRNVETRAAHAALDALVARVAEAEKALRQIEKRGTALIYYYTEGRPPREELTKDAQIARAALAAIEAGASTPDGGKT